MCFAGRTKKVLCTVLGVELRLYLGHLPQLVITGIAVHEKAIVRGQVVQLIRAEWNPCVLVEQGLPYVVDAWFEKVICPVGKQVFKASVISDIARLPNHVPKHWVVGLYDSVSVVRQPFDAVFQRFAYPVVRGCGERAVVLPYEIGCNTGK